MAFVLVVLGSKLPAPLHTAPVAMLKLPFRVTAALLPQTTRSRPAFTVGAAVMVQVTWSLTALQVPLPTELKVKVAVPAVRSAAVGV